MLKSAFWILKRHFGNVFIMHWISLFTIKPGAENSKLKTNWSNKGMQKREGNTFIQCNSYLKRCTLCFCNWENLWPESFYISSRSEKRVFEAGTRQRREVWIKWSAKCRKSRETFPGLALHITPPWLVYKKATGNLWRDLITFVLNLLHKHNKNEFYLLKSLFFARMHFLPRKS